MKGVHFAAFNPSMDRLRDARWRLAGALLLFVVSGLGSVWAQQMFSKTSPNCFEALNHDVSSFSELYVTSTGDSSDLGFDSAALYWARCKAASNLKRLQRLPQVQAKILKIRDLAGRLLTHDANLAAFKAGGGQVYSHVRSRAQASLESHVGRLIALAGSSAGGIQSRSIEAQYRQALAKINARVTRLGKDANAIKPGVKLAEWNRVSRAYAGTWQELRQVLGRNINAFSLEVLRFSAQGLFLP